MTVPSYTSIVFTSVLEPWAWIFFGVERFMMLSASVRKTFLEK